jgi:hypothetical protein
MRFLIAPELDLREVDTIAEAGKVSTREVQRPFNPAVIGLMGSHSRKLQSVPEVSTPPSGMFRVAGDSTPWIFAARELPRRPSVE